VPDDDFHSHVRLNSAERSKLLCRLDEAPGRAGRDRRRYKRWEYRMSDIAVLVQHPAGGTGRYLVCARNISAGGLSAIHGGYIHPGSECKIVLPRREGSPFAVTGVIVHCRHIEGSYHEIGIRFTQEVDPAALVPQMIPDGEGDADPDSDMPALEGRILVVDQSPADRKLMTHHLSGTALILKMVSSSGAAIDAVRKQNYDLILCDLHLENDAVRMIKKIRSSDYKGPIIVVTAESSAARLTEARAAGANEIIGKPHSAAYLASLLAEWLDVPGVDRPIMTAARELCVELVGSGTGFGFASVTEAARDALTAIDTAQNKKDAASSLKRLVAICQRLRCGNSARPMGEGWKQSA